MKTVNQTASGGIVYKKTTHYPLHPITYHWLICRHSQHKGWVFPKGLVGDTDSAESMEQAALREVEEEGGVKARIVDNKPVITKYQYIWEGKLIRKTVYYFLMEFESGDPKNHDWEMMDAKFVSSDEVKKTLTYDSDRKAFEKMLQRL